LTFSNAFSDVTKVLVINCGSSSIKYQLLAGNSEFLAGGLLERIGERESRLHHRCLEETGQFSESHTTPLARDHREAFQHIASAFDQAGMALSGLGISAIGHRVVHGGEIFTAPTMISPEVIDAIRELIPLAPLHNPANLMGIEVCRELFPKVPQVAVFDTAFHQTMPPHAYRYAIPEDWYSQFRVRRYGFHGSSHRFVTSQAAIFLGRPTKDLNLITLHLGNGASAAAIQAGRCIDTSMGLTPLEGLVMGTRSGDLDPAVPIYMQSIANLNAREVDQALNHEAGLKALAGSNDMRELLQRMESGEPAAKLAVDLYAYRIKKYIGSYLAALGKLDALIFTGGVGENASPVRSLVCTGLERLGIAIDPQLNSRKCDIAADISAPDATVRVLVIRTNEELQIARDALEVASVS
jgi:acetate kinase